MIVRDSSFFNNEQIIQWNGDTRAVGGEVIFMRPCVFHSWLSTHTKKRGHGHDLTTRPGDTVIFDSIYLEGAGRYNSSNKVLLAAVGEDSVHPCLFYVGTLAGAH